MDKKKQLKKHKNIATGLFIAMVLLYIIMVALQKQSNAAWVGYVKAFAEAAMVGALADWFAVTALFRHPMGVKIPHTNLIENRKNSIGENLGTFVTENFLTPSTIRPYIKRLNVAEFLANWLDQINNKNRIKKELIHILNKIIKDLDDSFIINFATTQIQDNLTKLPLNSFASQAIYYALDKKEEQRLIDLLIPKVLVYIDENQNNIYQEVIRKKPLLALIGGKAVTNQLIVGLQSFLQEIEEKPQHKLRQEISTHLTEFAKDLSSNEVWSRKLTSLLTEFATPDRINQHIQAFWLTSKEHLIKALNNDDSSLNKYIQQNIDQIAQEVQTNQEVQSKLNTWVQTSLYRLALKNSNQVASLIKNTVNQWDGRELSNKLELEVGKDLQYIRINGTLVGGLVGIIIYTITTLFL